MLHPQNQNQVYFQNIINAVKDLRFKNQYDIFSDTFEDYDFYSTYYVPSNQLTKDYKIGFMIFSTPKEVVEFRYTSGMIALIITLAGAALSIIFIMIFTSKMRTQISNLNYVAEMTGKGNLSHRVPIITHDELGQLGSVFNKMLDELKVQKESEKEYTEFITLLNQKPSLREIADSAVQKIIKATGISFGVLYLVEDKEITENIASYGIKEGINETDKNFDYYKNAIDQKDVIEFKYQKNMPVVRTGITEIRIKYIVIVPIIYSNEVVAVMELASEEIPEKDIKKYLLRIREQLALGIINGSSFEKLQSLVNELKELNQEYENQNRKLVELHSELETKAEQLNEERLKALESSKLKSQFLTNMTHELKTPLNSIIGLTQLINNDKSLSGSHPQRLTVIIRNSKKLLTLINNILEFSRAEAGKITIKNETFTLSSLLNEVNYLVQPNALEKGLNYICETPEEYEILLHADKSKIEQILLNLLNNSIKFTETGKVELLISLRENDGIVFEVKDTGIGIDKKDQEAIFEEFRQADGTISRQYDGTGLGLSICKKFVELMEGTFTLESDVGMGSKFVVHIPNVVIQKDGKITQEESKPGLAQKRVMILDESKTNKKLIGDYLLLNDYKLIESFSRENVTSKLLERKVECIIINQKVFDGAGWDILTEIKSNSYLSSVIPIMISTYDEKNYGYGLAVFDYVTGKDCEESCNRIMNNLKKEKNKDALNILSLSNNEKVNELLETNSKINLKNISKVESIPYHKNSTTLPDVLLFDLENASNIKLVDKLKHDRLTRGIELVAVLPDVFSSELKTKLEDTLNQVTLERKHHILDVLKIFRDRLKIAENDLARTKLLLEDESSETKPVNKSSEEIKVLVVDDDRDTLFTVGEIIKSNGFKPLFAKNGVECILGLKSEVPHVILLDIMMPKMDGFETLREIRKHPEYEEIPVVALTAYAMLDDKDIIDKSGFDDVLTKPIDSVRITAKLKEILKNKELY
ncbi:MAG: response regulator [Melioribacteraceae bacterium]|nr:response regulator [Melioribacteraceae bacterium]